MTGSDAAKIVRTVLCKRLSFEQTEQIIKVMVPVAAEAGTVVFREGDEGQGLFVLLEGSVEIVKQASGSGDTRVIATVEAPTVLGEMSLVSDGNHSATVRARTPCEFRLLTRSQFDRLLQAESLAAYKVVATLAEVVARRLQRMDEKVFELSRQRDCPPPVEELAQFKQKLFSEWTF